jgi:hypothetical protein
LEAFPKRRPTLERASARMLFSFERPGRRLPSCLSPDLENCTVGQEIELSRNIHRQDMKGTWWMPWHQEPMKDVDGCDKPR